MTADLATIDAYISDIIVAKTITRKYIDCNPIPAKRDQLFQHYEGLCKRLHQIRNVKESLYYKRRFFQAELHRCNDRSKYLFGV